LAKLYVFINVTFSN